MFRKTSLPIPAAVLALVLSACSGSNSTTASTAPSTPASTPSAPTASVQDAAVTATPIKHLVVIFGENVSFDHYFATYPVAANPAGEPQFVAAPGTPSVVGLNTEALLTQNPNFLNPANGTAASLVAGKTVPQSDFNPFRLDRSQANTADQSHAYTAEQEAYDNGAADLFPAHTGATGTAATGFVEDGLSVTLDTTGAFATTGQVMGYFDGNTATAMWNYAQHFAMNDNTYTDTYGPSTPGALEVVSGQTNGAVPVVGSASTVADGQGGLTENGDTDPANDVCSSKTSTVMMTSKNIGDLLNSSNITWGGFMGGFNLAAINPNGTTGCANDTAAAAGTGGRTTFSEVLGGNVPDYVQHHAWFQYYTSTANPTHQRPTSKALIGFTDPMDSTATPVHHQYDTNDFFSAVSSGNFPSVSYLKAPAIGDGHPGNSDPLDEQQFVTQVVNFLEQQPDWKNTAVIVTYDDSDGWYDHRYAQPTSASMASGVDELNGSGVCGVAANLPMGVAGMPVNGRCGPGTRIPLLVISPWAKSNFVSDTSASQASVVRFIEDNWLGGERLGGGSFDANAGSIMNMFDFTGSSGANTPLYLSPDQGTPLSSPPPINMTPT